MTSKECKKVIMINEHISKHQAEVTTNQKNVSTQEKKTI